MTITQTSSRKRSGRDRLSPSLATGSWVLLRVALGAVAAAVSLFFALALWFYGAITATGCFIECTDDPNLFVGIPSLIGAAALATVGLGAAWWGFVDRHWAAASQTLLIVGSVGAMLLVIGTISSV